MVRCGPSPISWATASLKTYHYNLESFRVLAEALAIGLLVGVERYRARKPEVKRFGSVRTFAAIALIGGICGLLGNSLFAAASFLVVGALVTAGYLREADRFDVGLTTEVAALAVFWLGFLVTSLEALALGMTIALAILLNAKRALHDFVRHGVSEREFFDTLKFLAMVLIVYPLLPDRQIGPWGFFNPSKLWFFVVLVSAVSFAGYVLVRWLGPKRGTLWSAMAGGLVSTTATTLTLAGRARRSPDASGFLGKAGGLANAVQLPKILVLAWIASPELGRQLLGPLAVATATAATVAWIGGRAGKRTGEAESLLYENPFSLRPALRFAAILAGVLLAVRAATAWFGDHGLLLASALAGAASASAVLLSSADLLEEGALPAGRAAVLALAALSTNALVKAVLAAVQGTRPFALRLAAAAASALAAAWLFWTLTGP